MSSERDTYPGRAGSRRGPRSQVGRGKVQLRCAGCGASRAPCTAARLGLPLPRARPRRSAALPARRPRPDPPLPAQGCGPRRREQRILGPSSPRPGRARWGGAGEREKEIKHLDLSLEGCQTEQSNYSPWGEKITKKKKKKKSLLLFSQTHHFSSVPWILRFSFLLNVILCI